jgi:hypothetical protein
MYDNYSPQDPIDTSAVDKVLIKSRNGIWLFGNVCWLFEICDKAIAIISGTHTSALDWVQLSVALVFFVGWLLLKPYWKSLGEERNEL